MAVRRTIPNEFGTFFITFTDHRWMKSAASRAGDTARKEDANIATEQLFYDNVDVQRTTRPGAFYTSTSNGSKVQLLRKSVQSKGAGQLLKVMSGDKIHVKVDYFIPDSDNR